MVRASISEPCSAKRLLMCSSVPIGGLKPAFKPQTVTPEHWSKEAFSSKEREESGQATENSFWLNEIHCGSITFIPQLDAETRLWLLFKLAEMQHYVRNLECERSLMLLGKKTIPSLIKTAQLWAIKQKTNELKGESFSLHSDLWPILNGLLQSKKVFFLCFCPPDQHKSQSSSNVFSTSVPQIQSHCDTAADVTLQFTNSIMVSCS